MTRCQCGRFIDSSFICCFCFKDSGELLNEPLEKDFWHTDEPALPTDDLTAEELIEEFEESEEC